MKYIATLRLIAMIFILATAIFLILTVANVMDSQQTREAIIKVAAVCGIVAASALALTFLGGSKT